VLRPMNSLFFYFAKKNSCHPFLCILRFSTVSKQMKPKQDRFYLIPDKSTFNYSSHGFLFRQKMVSGLLLRPRFQYFFSLIYFEFQQDGRR
jgi:hypothetical protein